MIDHLQLAHEQLGEVVDPAIKGALERLAASEAEAVAARERFYAAEQRRFLAEHAARERGKVAFQCHPTA